jgi:hypothetical protein
VPDHTDRTDSADAGDLSGIESGHVEPTDGGLRGGASTKHGAGRVLVVVYAVLAVASVSRAAYELLTKFSAAPVPYSLSAFAAVVYCVITWALIASTPLSRRIATVGMLVELVGVLVVGTLSVVDGSVFPKSSVWFWYGRDYLFIPLLLPILGLVFLRRSRAEN